MTADGKMLAGKEEQIAMVEEALRGRRGAPGARCS